jgi:hypothetical protein
MGRASLQPFPHTRTNGETHRQRNTQRQENVWTYIRMYVHKHLGACLAPEWMPHTITLRWLTSCKYTYCRNCKHLNKLASTSTTRQAVFLQDLSWKPFSTNAMPHHLNAHCKYPYNYKVIAIAIRLLLIRLLPPLSVTLEFKQVWQSLLCHGANYHSSVQSLSKRGLRTDTDFFSQPVACLLCLPQACPSPLRQPRAPIPRLLSVQDSTQTSPIPAAGLQLPFARVVSYVTRQFMAVSHSHCPQAQVASRQLPFARVVPWVTSQRMAKGHIHSPRLRSLRPNQKPHETPPRRAAEGETLWPVLGTQPM